MKRLLWYVGCCWTLSLFGAAASQASPGENPTVDTTTTGTAANLGRFTDTVDPDHLAISATSAIADGTLAQAPPPPPTAPEIPGGAPAVPPAPSIKPADSETRDLQNQLNNINNQAPAPDKFNTYIPRVSPGFSISNPTGFGADNNLFFVGLSYQNRTRFTQTSDGEAGFGVGLGDAVNSVGVELSYSINSFGSSQAFGSGAFNAKIHKRLSEDSAVAVGWNQFAQINLGNGRNASNVQSDFPSNSYYAVGSKIFRTCEDINQPLCRIAVTGGIGSGVFLPFSTIQNAVATGTTATGLNVFGSVGVRVARPVSAILEWTGQDLAAGVSIAPFDNFPLVITPAVRDITGAGDGARFILGAGVAVNF